MPATRSRTSTEAPEVAVEEKKTSDVTEPEADRESEVKETSTEQTTESSAEQSSADDEEKPVEENTNGSTTDALPSDTNGDQTEEKVENGSAKRKSAGDEAEAAPDSTDLTPKKAKLDAEADESNGNKETGAGEETDKQTAVETSA